LTITETDTSQTAEEFPNPCHVAIIMDGNGRWAAERGLSRSDGHKQGVESVRRIVKASIEFKIQYLTLFSFSSENWSRPQSEIKDLMNLIRRFIRTDLADLHKHGVRLRVIGARGRLEGDILRLIEEAVSLTSSNKGLQLTIAFNYGSRDEIVRAARRLASKAANGKINPKDITPDSFEQELDTNGLPDPDLLIRTSGEMRLSNFLLWQCAYTELVFSPTFWPDFGKEEFEQALCEFRNRNRRYGGLAARSTV